MVSIPKAGIENEPSVPNHMARAADIAVVPGLKTDH